jgi:hypothetical protein
VNDNLNQDHTDGSSWPPSLHADQDNQEDEENMNDQDEEDDMNEEEDYEGRGGFNEPTADTYPHSTSQDDSPALAIHRKRKRPDQETTSSSEDDEGHAKAQKINSKAGRPRARDYEDLAKELILQAATVYRCLLSTQDPFPELAHEADMVKKAWARVNDETGMTPLRLTPDIAKIVSSCLLLGVILMGLQIKARGSQARGEIKEKTKPLVEGVFGFDSGHGRKSIVANRKWAEELKRERGFIYKVSISFPFINSLYLKQYLDYYHRSGDREVGTKGHVPTSNYSESCQCYVVPEQAG